jgi:hypothetical protein
MDPATEWWTWWLSLVSPFVPVFTRPGGVRFVPWVTGMVLCGEEHTITEMLTTLGLESRWRVLDHFAEYGAWDREAVERHTLRLIELAQPARWGRYHPVAVDDTQRPRPSTPVWGTCTVHESSARSPTRAETVRAHNWVEMGDWRPGRPWTYLPHAARWYCRQSQLPAGEPCRTKTALAVELMRHADAESPAPILAVFDGASAVDTVVTPGLAPTIGRRRIELVTRRRADARRPHPEVVRPQAQGRPPTWGPRLAAPQHHLDWPVGWQAGRAWVCGRLRRFQDQQLRCRWAVSGPAIPVHVFLVAMAGDQEPWSLVATALDLTAAQVVEVLTARFRQEDAFRDHKPRLGMEECRAWTKEPRVRTVQVQLAALTLLRRLQARLNHAWSPRTWWLKPEWNPHKRHGSILDLRRLFWRHRTEFSQLLVDLETLEKLPQPLALQRDFRGRVA